MILKFKNTFKVKYLFNAYSTTCKLFAPYKKAFAESLDPSGQFWKEAAKSISWVKPFNQTLSTIQHPSGRWFIGGSLNTCYNAVDIHLDSGKGDALALIHDSPVTNTCTTYTFAELHKKVTELAGVLDGLGVRKGDMVIIYMPMVPEAIIGMLACARLGAVHSVVFGGFAANELATRIKHARPKVILSASCGIEGDKVIPYKPLLDKAIEISSSEHGVDKCIILQRHIHQCSMIPSRDIDWNSAVSKATPFMMCVTVQSSDPLYVLYTSGTTGNPKGVVRDNGGHAVALKWSMKNIYGVGFGDVFWAASDVGWVVGHSYITYGPLMNGCTTVMYEGKPVGTPDAGAFWRVISQHKVNVLFTAPTAIRAIRRQDRDGIFPQRYDLSSLRHLFLAGERSDPDTLQWAERVLGVPTLDHWWQTETGWPICGKYISS
jgi:propionyl-CoA synthetase